MDLGEDSCPQEVSRSISTSSLMLFHINGSSQDEHRDLGDEAPLFHKLKNQLLSSGPGVLHADIRFIFQLTNTATMSKL